MDPNQIPTSCREVLEKERQIKKAWEGASIGEVGKTPHYQLQRRYTTSQSEVMRRWAVSAPSLLSYIYIRSKPAGKTDYPSTNYITLSDYRGTQFMLQKCALGSSVYPHNGVHNSRTYKPGGHRAMCSIVPCSFFLSVNHSSFKPGMDAGFLNTNPS